MSHEGIRFVSREEARRAEQRDRPFSPEAVTPAKVRVDVSGGTGMAITWKDGRTSQWSFPVLRDACPCATCHEEREKTGRAAGTPKPMPVTVFPLFTEPARPRKAEPIGRYAIKFFWNDGHESGIYAWDYLRRFDEDLNV